MPSVTELQPSGHALTYEDKHSATWKRLKSFIEKEIDMARRKNDNDLSETATATLRGQIKALKRILALETDITD